LNFLDSFNLKFTKLQI